MGTITNSIDEDGMPHNAASHQGLHCFKPGFSYTVDLSLIHKDGNVSMDNIDCSLKSVIMTAVLDSFEGNTF